MLMPMVWGGGTFYIPNSTEEYISDNEISAARASKNPKSDPPFGIVVVCGCDSAGTPANPISTLPGAFGITGESQAYVGFTDTIYIATDWESRLWRYLSYGYTISQSVSLANSAGPVTGPNDNFFHQVKFVMPKISGDGQAKFTSLYRGGSSEWFKVE